MKNLFVLVVLVFISCQTQGTQSQENYTSSVSNVYQGELDTATFAGGCFWCVEASFEQIKGVVEAISGYSGGTKASADYKKVSYGRTNHAEAVQVIYDPEVIDYNTLLDIFFTAHDPTQLNRQGPDVGTQYRSEIFYHNAEQKQLAEAKLVAIASDYDQPVVTLLSKLDAFYVAEDYHQDFERRNPNQPYVLSVSKPKIRKVAKKFSHLLKDDEG